MKVICSIQNAINKINFCMSILFYTSGMQFQAVNYSMYIQRLYIHNGRFAFYWYNFPFVRNWLATCLESVHIEWPLNLMLEKVASSLGEKMSMWIQFWKESRVVVTQVAISHPYLPTNVVWKICLNSRYCLLRIIRAILCGNDANAL